MPFASRGSVESLGVQEPFASRSSAGQCAHCGSAVPGGVGDFCCPGCEAVHRLLVDEGLDRYYALAGGRVVPVAEQAPHGLGWLSPYVEEVQRAAGTTRIEFDVQLGREQLRPQ